MSFWVSIWTSSISNGMYLSASKRIALARSSSDIFTMLMKRKITDLPLTAVATRLV